MPALNQHIVVIPVYKPQMDKSEITSFKACCRTLGHEFPICLVSFAQLDLTHYLTTASECGITLHTELFSAECFEGIHGYNQLMISANFYQRFLAYDYMLVYQLDAFVFRNELDNWCQLGYDYVGAPLFAPNTMQKSSPLDFAMVGNGGFSLRKIATFAELLSRKLSIKELKNSKIKRSNYVTRRKQILYFLMLWAGGRWNGLRRFLTRFVDEDRFFCCTLVGSPLELKVPTAKEAGHFAFDMSAKFLFEQNNGVLPFGCHGWSRGTSFDIFYHDFIKLES